MWPEADLHLVGTDRIRGYFLARYRSGGNGAAADVTLGAHLDYRFMPLGFARIGYRHYFNVTGPASHENRELNEATLYAGLPDSIRVVNRFRVELRRIDGDFSVRFRERVRLERPFALGAGGGLRPYVMDEVFYDTRYDAFSRNRFSIGCEVVTGAHLTVDLSYIRQNDWRGTPPFVNALAPKLVVTY